MECNRETVKFDCFDTRNITVKVSAKELLEEGAKLLGVTALACCGRCEMLNNEALVEGIVKFCAIYKTAEGEIRKIERSERFGVNETIPGVMPKSYMLAKAEAEKVRGYVEAGSLMLTCSVYITGTLITPYQRELLTDLSGDDIRKREETVMLNCVSFTTPLRFTVTNDTELSLRVPEVKEILCINAGATVNEAHLSAGQLILGGQIPLQTIYHSADEYEPVIQVSDKIDFSQLIELKNVEGGSSPIVHLSVEDITVTVTPNAEGENRVLTYSVMLCGYAYMTEAKECTLINDAYSTGGGLECTRETIKLSCTKEPVTCAVNQHISVPIPEGKTPISRISSVNFTPVITACRMLDGRAELEGRGEVSVIYMASGSGELEGFNVTVPIRLLCDNLDFEEDTQMMANVSLTDMQAVLVSGGEVEIRAAFSAIFLPCACEDSEIITDARQGDACDMPEFGIIIYMAQKNETLWDICKRFGADMEEVRALNPDLSDVPQQGQKIYIFRKLQVC